MSMKAILVPVEPHDFPRPVLQTAFLLAQRFGAYLEGFAARRAPTGFDLGNAAVIPKPDLDDWQLVQDARRAFEQFMMERGVPQKGEAGGLSHGWRRDAPAEHDFVGSYGRVFDITVVGRPRHSGTSPHMSMVEAALFESGRPILVAPPEAPESLGETVAIAWNGSTETARTVALAMPLLERARQVVVLAVVGWGEPPGAEQLVELLTQNAIAAEPRTIAAEGRSVGEAILASAASLGCDLLVKGAYTQSRLRQMIFGGATIHILSQSALPVFMAH